MKFEIEYQELNLKTLRQEEKIYSINCNRIVFGGGFVKLCFKYGSEAKKAHEQMNNSDACRNVNYLLHKTEILIKANNEC